MFAILSSCGMAIIYGFNVNMSVAIVAMVNHTALRTDGDNQTSQVRIFKKIFKYCKNLIFTLILSSDS